jgi:caffeoyl-CoA O-methyltransferase
MYKLTNNRKLNHYTEINTSPEPILLQNLREYSNNHMPNSKNLLTSPSEGRILKLLVSISNAANILEIGTFTGHASLSMAEALPAHGKIISLEKNPDAIAIAQKFIKKSPHGHKIEIITGDASKTLLDIQQTFDFVFIDANKKSYATYYELALSKLRLNGMIAMDNMLWKGEVFTDSKSSIATYLDKLNQKIAQDWRVENVLLPINDGWNLIRKIKC